jgi:hypothetical protein
VKYYIGNPEGLAVSAFGLYISTKIDGRVKLWRWRDDFATTVAGKQIGSNPSFACTPDSTWKS